MIAESFEGLCCIKGCNDVVLAVGLCNKHWRRNKLYGSPVSLKKPAQSNKGKPAIHRFTEKYTVNENGCWIWGNGKDFDGYGLFHGTVDGVVYRRAHRFSIAYHKKLHPVQGQNVCHTCDVPNCVNPDHLFLGTVGDNQRDKWAKGRGKPQRGESHWGAKVTEVIVREIRASSRPQDEIAAKYGITQTTVSDIRRRKSWSKVI
jgi:hypothetical protein